MITAHNLSYYYPKNTRPALHKLSFEILEGDFVLLLGPSGAGKSTLLRTLNGLVPHFSGGTLSGHLRVNGLDPVAASPKVMSQHVGFVFQDPEAQFVMDHVEDEIAFALENAALPPQEMRVRVEEVLDLLDLAALRDRPLSTVSGGERQRVAIASALALRPKILVLDEPTSQLDPKSAEDVLTALVRLNHDLGLTILLAEHRLERILPFADLLLHLPPPHSEQPAQLGPPSEILPQLRPSQVPPLIALGQHLGWSPLPLTIKAGRRLARQWWRNQGEPVQPPSVKPAENPPPPLLRAEKISVAYNGQPVVQQVSLALHPGEIVTLMGRNGAGKSSLLKALMGLLEPVSGAVWLAERRIGAKFGLDVADLSRHVGYLPQDPNALLFAETVLDELHLTLRNHGYLPENGFAEAPLRPLELLTRLGLADKKAAYPRDLSVGERQRVALGAVMITKPQALLLDEPTRGLDYPAKTELAALLKGWRDEGLAVLVITHDVELAAQLADRVVLLSQGEIIAEGHPAQVLGASPLFAPQIARLFPETGWLTLADVLGAGG